MPFNKKYITDDDKRKQSEKRKQQINEINKAISSAGRDIGEIPAVVDQSRKSRCENSLREFCETYCAQTFYMGWSDDHLTVISRIEQAINTGGLFAMAMPRGSGKTTLVERAALWASLYGKCRFIVLIGASEDAALELLETIKSEIETNETIIGDFPEVCYPVIKLDGITLRANGQTCCGKHTDIIWSGKEIKYPTVDGSVCSGTTIHAVGITGRVRGMKRRIDGRDVRPDFVLVDDPQTDESASSAEQNRKRIRLLQGAILGLAGGNKSISGIMPCTVIRQGDMADYFLDRDKSPEWNGERMQLMKSMPSNMDLWYKYREVSADCLRRTGENADGTEFYREHRSEMDDGAVPSWSSRYKENQLSAVQYAMDLFFLDKESFFAEYQNSPVPDESEESDKIQVQHILDRLNNRNRFTVPLECEKIVAFCDVQKRLLYYVVMAFTADYTGYVIDYNSFPDQRRYYYSLSDATLTYPMLCPTAGLEGAMYAAIQEMLKIVCSRTYIRDDGMEMHVDKILVDSGYQRDTVCKAVKESQYNTIAMPSKGDAITANKRPISEYKKSNGDVIGNNWWIPSRRGTRTVIYDTLFWKSFFRQRLFSAMGDRGSFSVFGSGEERHRLFAEHLSSERSVQTSGLGRTVDVWSMIPNRENHFFDGVIGCYVAASMEKISLLAPKQHIKSSVKHNSVRRDGRQIQLGKTISLRDNDE